MKRALFIVCLWLTTMGMLAQGDPRALALQKVMLEGPIDSMRVMLTADGWTEWGGSDDGEDYYFRGTYYGIRAKLMVSVEPKTRLVSSAYVTIGPYSTAKMLERNSQYFLYKLKQEHGDLLQRDDAWVYMDEFGSIKLSVVDNGNGSSDIRILYYVGGPYYKDALTMGLHGPVQEVVTENAISEEQFLHFSESGQIDNPDLTNRQYDRYGYLRRAEMAEKEGKTVVEYEYDDQYRLVHRTLINEQAGVSYTHEYTYNDQGEILSQHQKVFEQQGNNRECVMTINIRNNYLTRDDEGNWTSNSVLLTYWEKGRQSRQSTVLQKRTDAYWE